MPKHLSITPSSQYFKSTDGGKTFAPNTITIKPTIQGEISFGKWQYSIDGGVSFADVVSGQKGLTISNNVLTVSKDSSLYKVTLLLWSLSELLPTIVVFMIRVVLLRFMM